MKTALTTEETVIARAKIEAGLKFLNRVCTNLAENFNLRNRGACAEDQQVAGYLKSRDLAAIRRAEDSAIRQGVAKTKIVGDEDDGYTLCLE